MTIRNILLTSLIFATLLTSRAQDTVTTPPVSIELLVDSIAKALYKTYIFPEKSKVMAAHLKKPAEQGG